MGAWLEAFDRLEPDAQDRVRRWIHVNKFIAHTLGMTWEVWVEKYLTPTMDNPLDYSFMDSCFPEFAGMGDSAASFSKEMDMATALVARVPLRAQNNLGRLSPDTQDAVAALLSAADAPEVKVPPGDVAKLQKIFRQEKAIATLKRKDFRRVRIGRASDDVIVRHDDGTELFSQSVLEFGAVMQTPVL